MTSANLALKSPLTGPLLPITEVPDPVFAQKMVGDGISIDPVSDCLIAPCDGKVVQLHRAKHAITLEAANGLQIMMHIGIDTVSLNGVGFTPFVALGDSVKCGDKLIAFDADFIATQAKSLLTQIIVLNSDQVGHFDYGSGFATSGVDTILQLAARGQASAASSGDFEPLHSQDIAIPNPTGLHARPTAVLVAEAKKFSSLIHLYKGGKQANAKSLVSIMALEVNCGDIINLVATGSDAQAALDSLSALIASGLGEDCPPVNLAAGSQAVQTEEASADLPAAQSAVPADPNLIRGVTASPGLAIGQIFQLKREDIAVSEHAKDKNTELAALQQAIAQAREQLAALAGKVQDKEKAAIFSAHQELLDDPELIDCAHSLIADGKTAAFAWKHAYTTQAAALARLKNELLAARANDLRDVGRRVLQGVLGLPADEAQVPQNTILIAEDLTPSDTANLDRERVLGFCTLTGGASSHVAILARAMNLPALAGVEARALSLANGSSVVLDADNSVLKLNPDAQEIERIRSEQARLADKQKHDLANAQLPAETRDGIRVEVVANVTNVKDTQQASRLGAEGVGLLRSEFLFMNRATAPSEDEQVESYTAVARALKPGQPLIIRTLDVGGDKPLPYLPIAPEENPFLGLRGIRVSLQKAQLFRTQLRAILRAAEAGNIHIMFPMITTIEDLRSAKAMLEEERVKLGVKAIPTGIMVEVPATAVMAVQFAKEVDFFSIGTNDLTQYTLAIDRGHPTLAAQADGLNPAVLQLIANTIEGAHKHGKWVGVCGGIASDPLAIPILIGMGIDELSVSVPGIPGIKAQVRGLSASACKTLAQQALQQDSASGVRELVHQFNH